MLTVRDVRQIQLAGPTVLTIGNFDGIHRGHQVLLRQLCEVAADLPASPQQRAQTALLTFDPHPLAVLRPGTANPLLTTPRERLILAAAEGIDLGIIHPFTAETARMEPLDFVTLLKTHLGLAALVVGPDFALGRYRSGDIPTLQTLGLELGYAVVVVDPVDFGCQPVRSSRVREALLTGAVDEAGLLLGRPYRVAGPVERGDQRGRAVGIPTANIAVAPDKLLPADGVYATRTLIATFDRVHSFESVTNIGVRPTVDGLHRRVETHILDFPPPGQIDDLYGETVAVDLLVRLRGEQRFASVAELVAQIHADILRARLVCRGRRSEFMTESSYPNLVKPMIRLRALVICLAVLTFASGCAVPAAVAQSRSGPKPPINDPNLLGRPNQAIKRINTLNELTSCVGSGMEAYGVTIQTTNVRVGPSTEACRIGKIPKGTLVKIVGLTEAKLAANASPAAGAQVGYLEDIQPIFNRSCASCHSAVAKNKGLQVTAYAALMAGSENGAVVVPGDPDASKLWEMVSQGKMPATGPLPKPEQALVRRWIVEGAAQRRAPKVAASAVVENGTWLTISNVKLTAVDDVCIQKPTNPSTLVSGDLIIPVSCGGAPATGDTKVALASGATAAPARSSSPAGAGDAEPEEKVPAVSAAVRSAGAGQAGISAAVFGLPEPSEGDPYLTPAGFCIERRLAENSRGITALSFAPDGRLFMALDSDLSNEIDPVILYDAYHPSRTVAVYDWVNDMTPVEIFGESSRITGLFWQNGSLYLSRAGEVGRIPDGGTYEPLAGGFAVTSQLFHANNGLTISGGWMYVSAGGVRDGYVEGPIAGVGEQGAQDIVSGGNPFAARIVRAPLDALLSSRSIGAFSTAARGVRNPYGITHDPSGRIWFTDNGATNVPEEISAGDEVDLLDPATFGGDDGSSPYYGFPLALSGPSPDWYTGPVVTLPNSAAPTGIAWAYDTVFFAQYGRNPGLYRLGRAGDGTVVAERIMMAWPILSLATAPDGALWIGMGNGGLYRVTPGC